MKRPLTYYGHPVLRKKTSPVTEITPEIRQLVEDMFDTMDAQDGCGLAAPQVNESISIFVTCIPKYDEETKRYLPGEKRVFINPKIVQYSEECWTLDEGCLSIPGLREDVIRPFRVTFQAMDLNGQPITEEFEGFDARAMMHENDHLNGVLYIDRLSPKKKKELELKLRKIKKTYNPHL